MKVLNDYLLLDITKQEKTQSGIYVSTDKGSLVFEEAKVIEVGDEVKKIKVGDTVYFKAYYLETVQAKDKELSFIKESQITAINESPL